MSLILDELPTSVEVDGLYYRINSDFRVMWLFELLNIAPNDPPDERVRKILKALSMFYDEYVPPNLGKAFAELIGFYSCYKKLTPNQERYNARRGGRSNAQIYSYEHDDDLIYAAFLSQYGVDLHDIDYLHWFKYKAMFRGLEERHEIVKIMEYRAMDLSKIKNKEQKRYFKEMQDYHALPVERSKAEDEKIRAITEALRGNGDLRGLL